MDTPVALMAVFVLLVLVPSALAQSRPGGSEWTVYVANDNCPDYTWGMDAQKTEKAFADIVRAHLDEMNRTEKENPQNQDRYNMAVTNEALAFLKHYGERKDELIRRVKEGRVFVSPFLCNSLWGFHSIEGAVRTMMPARRLEKEWGVTFDVAEHIEEPSLPWGMATVLAGCGVRWVSVPFYGYDSTFGALKNPPLFIHEGPDGSQVRVVMDPWASNKASYTQGAAVLRNPDSVVKEWVPHYQKLGKDYPLRAILASGTHGDISPHSGNQARGFAGSIINHNAAGDAKFRLVNATLPMFCKAVDDVQTAAPFLPTVRGCFGHSWDVWPVSLATVAAEMRQGERKLLAAEALAALAGAGSPEARKAAQTHRLAAEHALAMLSDHAWNGTDDTNRRHNASLRRKWAEELDASAGGLLTDAWIAMGHQASDKDATLLNSLSFPRRELVRLKPPVGLKTVLAESGALPVQQVTEDGQDVLYFVSSPLPPFSLTGLTLSPQVPNSNDPPASDKLRATETELESPFYRLKVDPNTGGVASLVHKPGGEELLIPKGGRTICQTVHYQDKELLLRDVKTAVVATGPVLARLEITGSIADMSVVTRVTVYAELDRVDFQVRVGGKFSTAQQRLCQVFPVLREGATLRIETPAAVIRPRPQPEGDLLPGADTRRFAVQGFVDVSSASGVGVTIASPDAFVLRTDLDPVTFEAFGNDQNYKEVIHDQGGATSLSFRYSLRAHKGDYSQAEAVAWSRSVATPPPAMQGTVRPRYYTDGPITIDPARAIATCLKPAEFAEEGGCLLRLWETGGKSGPLTIGARGFRQAFLTDLLERPIRELKVEQEKVTLDLRPFGLAAVRLVP